MIKNRDKLIHINDDEVMNISEWNLIHDIINPPQRAKIRIATTPLFYIDVLILEKGERCSKTSKFY